MTSGAVLDTKRSFLPELKERLSSGNGTEREVCAEIVRAIIKEVNSGLDAYHDIIVVGDPKNYIFEILHRRTVVEMPVDACNHFSIEQAREYIPDPKIGDILYRHVFVSEIKSIKTEVVSSVGIRNATMQKVE